jgi:hypothetical protein
MVRDPRRLYAHGRLYHIVERKPFRYEFATLFNLLISIIIVFIAFRCLCTNSIIVNRCRIKVFVSIIVLAFPVQVPVNWTVGDLFSNAMNQEQGNIEIVKCYSPSSFEALFPSGYNGFWTKVMKVIPS